MWFNKILIVFIQKGDNQMKQGESSKPPNFVGQGYKNRYPLFALQMFFL